ncbi:uncharacterized protein BX663DRAFT_518984 [Cokeromyces recurvatus]|uniref:uncharacterized protein n=1 Tax=Cokeromyces recurvatus TaxID=90255 RepID=UPI002220CE7A|nr:uncharacterized protein BX663DRAFT_522188 [Cokeromyces recurvatus]XP_051380204.1 uncharacterized protein BX663DRAFT_518984 [Cokeromyces recurvatus]KAI7899067.1 hypothetical protein BX663DRAFT_522188 [Cokeromyces recurvatus]KAI7900219.1 hypothetical protein BX663DRAFT_518984 [Cokeromyces recurvatus]
MYIYFSIHFNFRRSRFLNKNIEMDLGDISLDFISLEFYLTGNTQSKQRCRDMFI